MRAARAHDSSSAPSHTPWMPVRSSSSISGEIQLCACTPFVIDVIGTSSTGTPGHIPLNISRLTAPCSLATPLARAARRSPMTAMLKRVSSGSSSRWPIAISSSNVMPTCLA